MTRRHLIYDPADGYIMAYGFRAGARIHPKASVIEYDEADFPDDKLAGKRIDLGTIQIVDKYSIAATMNGTDVDIVTDCPDALSVEFFAEQPAGPDPLPENPTPEQKRIWKDADAQLEKDMRDWEESRTVQTIKPSDKAAKVQLGKAPTKAGKMQDGVVVIKHRLCVTDDGRSAIMVKDKKIKGPPKPGGKKPSKTKGMAR